MGIFHKLLAASAMKLGPGGKTRLKWNDGSVVCLMDQQEKLLFCVVTARIGYPERTAYELLYEMAVATKSCQNADTVPEHGLDKQLGPHFERLVAEYENPASSAFQLRGPSGESRIAEGGGLREEVAANASRQTCRKVFFGLSLLTLAVAGVAFYLFTNRPMVGEVISFGDGGLSGMRTAATA